MTFVDTNVLLDLFSGAPPWADWARPRLESAALAGPMLINDVVYAELCPNADSLEEVDNLLAMIGAELAPIPRPALFLAAKAFTAYRRRGGTRTGVLPDFFIGAHAAIVGAPLLTRDASRYRTYFPTLELIAP